MKVSILIPCYNAERWVAQAIQSALDQTWQDKEVIVVDDGSTDGSLEVIQSFAGEIRWETGPNRGGNVARNRLLELASGEWIQYLDADDYLEPWKVERQLQEAGNIEDLDVIYSPVVMEHNSAAAPPQRSQVPIRRASDPWTLLITWELPQTGAPLWKKSSLLRVGGWKLNQVCCQEHELYERLLAAGCRFHFAPSSGAIYRQWSTNTVCRKDPRNTIIQRLNVVRSVEQHLLQTGQMTAERRDAIAATRVECARSLNSLDPELAVRFATEASRMHPRHRLPRAACFPWVYRWVYSIAGFRVAEALATFARLGRTMRSRYQMEAGER